MYEWCIVARYIQVRTAFVDGRPRWRRQNERGSEARTETLEEAVEPSESRAEDTFVFDDPGEIGESNGGDDHGRESATLEPHELLFGPVALLYKSIVATPSKR